ncbi:MAG: peptidase G2 autoproteolytic cleavage domain-containing protein, partial [Desulfurivibrionaceae bacterium]
MRRHHNAYFHGAGIIGGLEVASAGKETGKVKVSKGAAINRIAGDDAAARQGREIVLLDDETVHFVEHDVPPGYSGEVYVCLGYADVPDLVEEDKGGDKEIHLWEKASILCKTSLSGHDDLAELILAKVTIDAEGAITAIDNSSRRYAGFEGNVVKTKELEVVDNAEVGKNLTVRGNLKVEGDFEKEVVTKDDIIILNKGTRGPTSTASGIEIFRGAPEPARLLWNETDGRWQAVIGGTAYDIIYGPDLAVDLATGNMGIGGSPLSDAKLAVTGDTLLDGDAGITGNTVIGTATAPADLTVTGNLKVAGDFEKEVVAKDDIIILNKGTGGPTSTASGIEIFRGAPAPARLLWNETDGRWQAVIGSTVYDIVYGPGLEVDLATGNMGIGGSPHVSAKLAVTGDTLLDGDAGITGNTVIGTATAPADLTVTGNLKVEGNFEKEVVTKDDIILLNKGATGPTSTVSGLEIYRGTAAAARLVWDNTAGQWLIGVGAAMVPIATTNQLSTGVSRDIKQAGHGFKVGQAIYFDGQNKAYQLARSDNETTVGIFLVSRVQDKDNFTLVQAGYIAKVPGLVPGEYYYVSDTEAGALTTIEPAGISNPILVADSDSSGFVLPYRPSALGPLPQTSGVSRDILQKAHGFKPGQALYFDAGLRRYALAICSEEMSTGLFLVAKIIDENNFTLVQAGYVQGLKGLIPGEYYYVSDKEPGLLTTIEPVGISNPLLLADSDTSGYVLPYRPSDLSQIPVSPWVEDGGNVSYTKGNVGIGIAKPAGRLHVTGGDTYLATGENEAAVIGSSVKWPYARLSVSGRVGGASMTRMAIIEPDGKAYGALTFAENPATPSIGAQMVAWGSTSSYPGQLSIINYRDAPISLSTVEGQAMTITGKRNVGIQTSDPKYTLHTNGTSYAVARAGGGIDYAEYFESLNGKEIPPGTAVVLEKGKIRAAKKNELPFGIISTNPLVVGGVHPEWPGKYLRDEFGNLIMEKHRKEIMVRKKEKVKRERQKTQVRRVTEEVIRTEVVRKKNRYCQVEVTEQVEREIEEPLVTEVDLYDAKGKEVIGTHRMPVMETIEEEIEVLDKEGNPVLIGSGKFEAGERPKLNPAYDAKKKYIPREQRPEWNCVGLLGQLP